MAATKAVKDQWGYPFGADGLLTLAQACEKLAMSHDTLSRLAESGKLRVGRHAGNLRRGKSVVCKRSIEAYLKSIEMQLS
mgnify:CR=1 FL=1